ncbi:MAG: hypothetical protein J5I98_24550 [Phaeodactylibacter sp.]|nr:hypothetical protein [Phaeodactylibacter sp.]
MNDVEVYIADQESPQQEIMGFLHQVITAYPEVSPKIRYNIPWLRLLWPV